MPTTAFAGPPFTTDDPETVKYRHWELYLASQVLHRGGIWSGTAPQVEVNYGLVSDLQVHALVPLSYFAPNRGRAHYGIGDTELGVKFRFLHESKWTPMMATFPVLEAPSGSPNHGLGNGSAEFFLPVWLQKTIGPWQTYGGVGVWLDLGDSTRHWWFFGWAVQRQICKAVTLGVEVFHQTPPRHGEDSDTRVNVGAIFGLSEVHHLLVSAGGGLELPNAFQGYFAYVVTLGPAEKKMPSVARPDDSTMPER